MNIDKLKIAFVGCSHWHVPLYLPAVKTHGLNVVAVSDARGEIAELIGGQLGCNSYTNAEELLDKEKPDFVFAYDIHSKMPALAKSIIERDIPFSIEKPLGVCSQDVIDVKTAAEAKGLYVSIPFVWRYSELVQNLKKHTDPHDYMNFSYINVAGPPSRYEKPSPWMLKAETAGTGCMTNLGVHFIDMSLYLSGSASGEALGSVFHYMNGYDIEDYASTLVKLSSGASMMLQTAYAYPMDSENKRDNVWNFTTTKGYYTIRDDSVEIREYGRDAFCSNVSTDSDGYYAVYTAQTLQDYLDGVRPKANLDDMLATRLMLDDIIAKAGPAPKATR